MGSSPGFNCCKLQAVMSTQLKPLFAVLTKWNLNEYLNDRSNRLVCFAICNHISKHYIFFSLFYMSAHIRFRQCITPKKNMCFFLPSSFFCLFFLSPSITICQMDQKFFLLALSNFLWNLSNIFFILSPSLTFPKIGSMFFFSNVRFWIFSDLKQITSDNIAISVVYTWLCHFKNLKVDKEKTLKGMYAASQTCSLRE